MANPATYDPTTILEPNDTEFNNRVVVHDIDLPQFLSRPTDKQFPSHYSNRKPYVMILENVCTPEECQRLIDLSEAQNYTPALLNIGGGRETLATDVRNNDRYIRDDPELAELLWRRLKYFIPATFANDSMDVVGLNERLRFLRYDPGQKFEAHMDGTYYRPGGQEMSCVTIQLYLNEGFKGGETTFLGSGRDFAVVPKTGMVLIFEHALLHEGSAVTEGRKYAIRTDVMYRRKPKV
ncbi:hypothetical protein BC937DRAFT_87760 [Endogone sp. FLAS-F59071]|nr:hypothetical protein BC937DRAFT_87760 [Endogone sp. FLAS-F59071]|eukprot:RUS19261.1 hypothetical protein BC937DRAFT_87760 [Endogone sp. FLAS-F59071]